MKQITLKLDKKNIEDILGVLIKYRQSLMDVENEFSEKYKNSLSHTGCLLEMIKGQSTYELKEEVSLDIESYMNLCDVLKYSIDGLNEKIINNLTIGYLDLVDEYKEERDGYKELYDELNARRFEVLHM